MGTRRKRFWTCTRKTDGIKCNTLNEAIKRNCKACGKAKPAPRRPKHMAALNESYEYFIDINGGETCGICGAPPKTRRLDRDHAHTVGGLGEPRGLLCPMHNKWLPHWMTLELARGIVAYLERHEARMGRLEDVA